jgi:hypothetical protein
MNATDNISREEIVILLASLNTANDPNHRSLYASLNDILARMDEQTRLYQKLLAENLTLRNMLAKYSVNRDINLPSPRKIAHKLQTTKIISLKSPRDSTRDEMEPTTPSTPITPRTPRTPMTPATPCTPMTRTSSLKTMKTGGFSPCPVKKRVSFEIPIQARRIDY